MASQAIETNPFQQKVLLCPEQADLFLGGGRGGGKSYALALLALRHIAQYGSKARILYIRKTYRGLFDFELICRELFGKVYGGSARYNATDHVWRFADGAYLELGQLETASDYQKFQGHSYTLLLGDEVGQYSAPDLLDILRSNLRAPRTVQIRVVLAGNPGGAGHGWLAKRYVFCAAPWTPFIEQKSKRDWIYAPSTFAGNTFIDTEQYEAQLRSSCPYDEVLLKSWVDGDWAIARGAFFNDVIDEGRNAVAVWKQIPETDGVQWETFICHDWGSSAPSVTYIVAVSPGAVGPDGKYYSRGSLIFVDEIATAKPDRPNEGLQYTVPILSELIVEKCKAWNVRPSGVADDAIFSQGGHASGSIADEFRRCGVFFSPARKAGRIPGWAIMKRLLQSAGRVDVPGLYISRACAYFWNTVPFLGRDIKRIEDCDSSGPDHAADAARYGCLKPRSEMAHIPLEGI